MLASYLRLGGVDIGSTCDDEADISREIMSGWQDGSMARWVDGKIGLGCDRQREPGRKGIEKGWVDRVRVRWSSSNNRSCLWDGGLAQHISSAAAAKSNR
jgi:hypothetical protein